MKSTNLILIAMLYLSMASAQSTRGLSLPAESKTTPVGKTYALIVGISKYKNAAIPQLQFADRDAVAFRNYLVATGVDSNNIILRTNEEARYADIMLDLHELCTERAKAGDKVFIYFSGHGDVESQVITNDGYLLPYDAPRVVYSISAIEVRKLQAYVATLSSRGVQAIVITDACHSGSLAGGIEGLKNIQAVLKETWKDEVKILSCQPGELSLEGRQWGGGRGLFSYELINGMAGMADKNNDGEVSLRELNLYLMEKVPDGANPLPQNPMISGNMPLLISKVDKPLLTSLSAHHAQHTLAAVDVKGFDEALVKNMPDSIIRFYHLFKMNLDSNRLGSGSKKDTSAYFYYQKIPPTESTKVLLALIKRNLAASIIDDMTRHIERTTQNDQYISNEYEIDDSYQSTDILYQLLGTEQIHKLGLTPKMLYGKATQDPDLLAYPTENALKLLDSAVHADHNASYASGLYAHALYLIRDYSLSKKMALNAIAISPMFFYPYRDLIEDYLHLGLPDSALYYTRQWRKVDTAKSLREYDFPSNKVVQKTNLQSDENKLTAECYFLMARYDSADIYFRKSNPDIDSVYLNGLKASLLYSVKQYPPAIALHKLRLKKLQSDTRQKRKDTYDITNDSLGITSSGREYTDLSNTCFSIAICYIGLHQTDSAIHYLDQSAAYAFQSYDSIFEHPYIHYYSNILIEGLHRRNHIPLHRSLDPIRSDPQYKTLMKKYFPKEYKE